MKSKQFNNVKMPERLSKKERNTYKLKKQS